MPVVLCDVADQSYDHIATTLGVPVGTVRSRIHRGRRLLRTALTGEEAAVTPPELSEDLLSAYVDDELDDETRAALDARLATSPEWRAILDEVRAAARGGARPCPASRWRPPPGTASSPRSPPTNPHPTRPRPRRRSPLLRLRRAATTRPARWIGGVAAAAAVVVAALVLPTQAQVTPKVGTFSTEQSARASVARRPGQRPRRASA